MNTITLPATTSALTNVLLRVITGAEIPWNIAASAAELVALDLRFNDWILTAKTSATDNEFNEALELMEQRTKLLERLWSEYEAAPSDRAKALGDAIERTCDDFRTAIGAGRVR